MLDKILSFKIYRLFYHEGFSKSRIASYLGISRTTVRNHLAQKQRGNKRKKRTSKLDPYKDEIQLIVKKFPWVSCAVILQRIRETGYTGGKTILGDYVRTIREKNRHREAYIRYESPPGMLGQVDWGYFGTLSYGAVARKLYCFVLLESHSRIMYLEFTHSMRFETFIRCHVNAFRFLGGIPRSILYDNLVTAVREHIGRFVQFNGRFLEFARHYDYLPKACNKGAPHEKGKVESGGIRYIRNNFFPLRVFTDLHDTNKQAWEWMHEIANKRMHTETRERPIDRFKADALRPLPPADFDTFDTQNAKVHKDLRLNFDANRYCVPPKYIGKKVMIKADSHTVHIYDGPDLIIQYPRCWNKYQVIGAEQFEKALLKKRQQAHLDKSMERFCCLGDLFSDYLVQIAQSNTKVHLQRQVDNLNRLVDTFGKESIASAIEKANEYGAYGSEYIENIMIQMRTPPNNQPPVVMKDEALNRLVLDRPCMEEYDQLALMDRRKNHGRVEREIDETQTQNHEQ